MIRAISGASGTLVFKSGEPVSAVCVAATYTGVTYANNGGKVQLSSTGVHGLTTSPAVGASVYVSWASGTGVSGLYNVNSVDDANKITIEYPYVAGLGTPTIAALSTYISMASLAIPALSANGRINVSAGLSMLAVAALRELNIRLNGVTIAGRNSSSGTIVLIPILGFAQNRGATNSQITSGGSALEVPTTIAYTATSIDTSVPTVLSFKGYVAAANSPVKLEQYIVEVFV